MIHSPIQVPGPGDIRGFRESVVMNSVSAGYAWDGEAVLCIPDVWSDQLMLMAYNTHRSDMAFVDVSWCESVEFLNSSATICDRQFL